MPSFEELYVELTNKLMTLANAIRNKTGKGEPLSIDAMAAEQDAVFDAGKNAEYDASWANLRGEIYFPYAFSGYYWTDSTFKPPFDIKPVGMASAMFRQNKITNLKKCFEDTDTSLDTTLVTRSDYMFAYSNMLTAIPKLDLSASTNAAQAFYECTSLVTIEEVKFGESTTFASTFYNCKELVNMIVTGVIAQNGFNMNSSKKLSKASITSIINALSATTSGLTVTISKTSVVAAFGSTDAAEWTALVATKPNWTISLS